MKRICGVIILILFLVFPSFVSAQAPYTITNFASDITINQDSSLTVKETIDVVFHEPRHGIFRTIPVVYKTDRGTVKTPLQVYAVTDSVGKRYKYEVSRMGESVEIKIGDEDVLVSGTKHYTISYRVRNVLQRFDTHEELYWNVVGSGWDTTIQKASATVHTAFAPIDSAQCYSGPVGRSDAKCAFDTAKGNSATFDTNIPVGNGSDMTIVLGMSKENSLIFTPSLGDKLYDSWGYPLTIIPFLIFGFMWITKGRDVRRKGDNVYFESGEGTETVPAFGKREFLPLVYSPIQGLSPAELGVLIDEKIDIHDIVAEIVELARLGFLKIEKVAKKMAKDDYRFLKKKTDTKKLRSYQEKIFDAIFEKGETDVLFSDLKKTFAQSLPKIRSDVYSSMVTSGYFPRRPDYVRIYALIAFFVVQSAIGSLLMLFQSLTGDFAALIVFGALSIPTFVFAFQMPRKTPKGYAYFRQAKGLAFYINKGKWRQEINEKHLFLEEMLPLAISLGVVKKLARDMEALKVPPPSYMPVHSMHWASTVTDFNSAATSSVAGASHSGGSGFSGGSGGGFGGGGGGSW